MGVVARQLWETSGLGSADMHAAVLDDHSRPTCSNQLEELGFCAKGRGEGVRARRATSSWRSLPLDTDGGQLGEAYLHGMNGIAEAVRLSGARSVNQVPDLEHVVVTAGTGVPTSGLVLGVDR